MRSLVLEASTLDELYNSNLYDKEAKRFKFNQHTMEHPFVFVEETKTLYYIPHTFDGTLIPLNITFDRISTFECGECGKSLKTTVYSPIVRCDCGKIYNVEDNESIKNVKNYRTIQGWLGED